MTASKKVANLSVSRPSREEAQKAVETLIRWAGDNPAREGLRDTPERVVSAYEEFFAGYAENPEDVLRKTFEDIEGYEDVVLLKNMRFESHCEHHIVPIIGIAHIAYLPNKRVVGLSKLARLLDVFAKRLQTQETMTVQIANVIEQVLQPRGVAVVIDAYHQCMTTRGVYKSESSTITRHFSGIYKTDMSARADLMQLLQHKDA